MKRITNVGPCRLIKELPSGSLGQRYLSEMDDRRVFLETICMRSNVEVFERALRRIELMAMIEHQHLVPVLTAGTDQGVLFIATPVPDLAVEGQMTTEIDALAVIRDAACGLAALHEHGVIHRDIQLRHMNWYDGIVKLGGFAMADVSGPDSTQGVGPIGSISTMAPSVVRGMPATTGSDLYSLGAALHQAATGIAVHPERCESLADRIVRIASEPPVIDPSLAPELVPLVTEALLADGTTTTVAETEIGARSARMNYTNNPKENSYATYQ